MVIFAHGYSTNPDAYLSTLQHVASWGMVVVAPEVCPLLLPPLHLRLTPSASTQMPAMHHLRFANVVTATITAMEAEAERDGGCAFRTSPPPLPCPSPA